MFSPFQIWALTLPVPALGLAGLTRAGQDDLEGRAREISFDLCPQTDRDLAQCFVELGALDYLKEAL